MAEIRVEGLHKAFHDFVAVQDSNFVVNDRSFFVMLGPSGCGKTTTLRMIAGLELPSDGRILLDGEDVTFKRAAERDIAFVFQLFALYPHMNVANNIGFPLKCEGVAPAESSSPGRGDGPAASHRGVARSQGVQAFRRRPSTRGAWARDHSAPEGVHDG